jgi:1,4-alpha-glucan branching enzyme
MAEIHEDATLTPTKLELLEQWMGGQRWYAAKGRQPRLRLLANWRLDDPAGEVGIDTLIVSDDAGESPVVYQVPLTYRGEPLGSADHALVGTMEHSVLGMRWVYDAPHDPVYAAQLFELVQGRAVPQSGVHSDTAEDKVAGHPDPSWATALRVQGSRVLSGEQSNTSVILDCEEVGSPDPDAEGPPHTVPLIVKVFRMLQPGENPDVVLQSALVEAGCHRVPRVVGAVTGQWRAPDGGGAARGHLAFAQEFLPGVEDAWRVALRAVEDGEDFTERARALGEATAEVHALLGTALGTEPTTPARREAILAGMRVRASVAQAEAGTLAEHADAIEEVIAAAGEVLWPPLQRIHGDYHLGQVLHSAERGWVLLDFEGEPLRPLTERSQPDQCARDVAGMLRSFDYIGGTWEHEHDGSAREWVHAAQDAFIEGYAAAAPVDPRSHPELLAAFELDKALYEVVYEARNRPSWLTIPLHAVDRLTARFVIPASASPNQEDRP